MRRQLTGLALVLGGSIVVGLLLWPGQAPVSRPDRPTIPLAPLESGASDPIGTLVVVVANAQTGVPIPNAQLESRLGVQSTDVEGKVVLKRALPKREPEELEFRASAPGFAPSSKSCTFSRGVRLERILLAGEGSVSGKATAESGEELAGVSVSLVNEEHGPVVLTGPDGRFRLEGVVPGKHVAEFSKKGFRPERRLLDVVRESHVNVVLRRARRLVVYCQLAGWRPRQEGLRHSLVCHLVTDKQTLKTGVIKFWGAGAIFEAAYRGDTLVQGSLILGDGTRIKADSVVSTERGVLTARLRFSGVLEHVFRVRTPASILAGSPIQVRHGEKARVYRTDKSGLLSVLATQTFEHALVFSSDEGVSTPVRVSDAALVDGAYNVVLDRIGAVINARSQTASILTALRLIPRVSGGLPLHGAPGPSPDIRTFHVPAGGYRLRWNELAVGPDIVVGQDETRTIDIDKIIGTAGGVRGRVMPPARVVVWTWDGSRTDVARILSDADGRFEIRNVRAGEYRLSAEWNNGSTTVPVSVQGGRVIDVGTLRRTDLGLVHITLRTPDGNPLPAREITARVLPAAGNLKTRHRTDESGTVKVVCPAHKLLSLGTGDAFCVLKVSGRDPTIELTRMPTRGPVRVSVNGIGPVSQLLWIRQDGPAIWFSSLSSAGQNLFEMPATTGKQLFYANIVGRPSRYLVAATNNGSRNVNAIAPSATSFSAGEVPSGLLRAQLLSMWGVNVTDMEWTSDLERIEREGRVLVHLPRVFSFRVSSRDGRWTRRVGQR